MATSVKKLLDSGVAYHQLGKFLEAEKCYRKILAIDENNSNALHLLGLIALSFTKHDAAQKLVEKAIKISPKVADYYNSLGEILRARNRLDKSRIAYQKCLELDSNNWRAMSNLGLNFSQQGRSEDAIHWFKCALENNEANWSVAVNLAKSYIDREDYQEAIELLTPIVERGPNNWQAWTNLSIANRLQGNSAQARECINTALELQPEETSVLIAYGAQLVNESEWNDASKVFRRVLKNDPNNLDALNNLGSLNREFQKYAESIAFYNQVLAIDEWHSNALYGLADAYMKLYRFNEARKAIRKALEVSPETPESWNLLSKIERETGNWKLADEYLNKAIEFDRFERNTGFGRLFYYNYEVDADPQLVKAEHEKWASRYASRYYPREALPDWHTKKEKLLKVGLVSGDWRLHPVGQFTENLLRFWDDERMNLFCYSALRIPTPRTEEFRDIAARWYDISRLDDEAFCDLIGKNEIDILIDLQAHTSASRLLAFARQPAQVQVSYLGYPNTTGLSTMHYRLTDALADPEGLTDNHFVEKLVRIKGCAWNFAAWKGSPEVHHSLQADKGHITFGCFNNFLKSNKQVYAMWARILRAIANSRIILKSKTLADSDVASSIAAQFQELGISNDRIICRPWQKGIQQHLSAYQDVDIALDTFPYHGTTTTCEAMYMGVPVIVLAGKTHVSRVGVSLLSSVGLEEFIAETEDEYVEKAVALAQQPERLAEVRRTLRSRMENSLLMDGPGFAKRFGDALEDMWRVHLENQSANGGSQ